MKTVRVDIGERSYDIRIGMEWDLGEAVEAGGSTGALIVSDSNVAPVYADRLASKLLAAGLKTDRIILAAGEESKSLQNMENIYNAAINAGLDRKSIIVALGGGMVGDIAGFAAATFMRGIDYLQVPTSLLAMVDSSVGGKTAVNLDRGKNLVGSFHQPIEVDIALDTLETLPERQFSSGMAEVIKYGIIWDAAFLSFLEENMAALMARDREVLVKVISRCCEIKSEVVAVDELESGVRGILNFGHTLGHSVENLSGYGNCLHGEAVSIGMVYAMRVSVLHKDLDPLEEVRVRNMLKAAGLPVSVSELEGSMSWNELREIMTSDKKTVGGIPRFVLAQRMGEVVFGCEVPEERLRGAFEALEKENS